MAAHIIAVSIFRFGRPEKSISLLLRHSGKIAVELLGPLFNRFTNHDNDALEFHRFKANFRAKVSLPDTNKGRTH